MSDMGDDFRAYREEKRAYRRRHGIPCEGCTVNEPKRNATILLPGQKCNYCGYVDKRERLKR